MPVLVGEWGWCFNAFTFMSVGGVVVTVGLSTQQMTNDYDEKDDPGSSGHRAPISTLPVNVASYRHSLIYLYYP